MHGRPTFTIDSKELDGPDDLNKHTHEKAAVGGSIQPHLSPCHAPTTAKLSKQRNKIEQPLQLKVSGRGDLARSVRLQAATDSTPCPSYSSLPIASCAAGASPCSAMEAVSNEINL